jgi:membrane protease subunit HflK
VNLLVVQLRQVNSLNPFGESMAWNEPGGRDPWKGKNDQGPPDLDELLRRLRRRLRQGLGGRGREPKLGGWAGLGLFIVFMMVIWLISGFYMVQPAERALVMRFGSFHALRDPGPHWHLPYPVESVEKLNIDGVREAKYRGAVLLQDGSIINIDMTLQYRIDEPQDFLFNLRNAESSVRDTMISVMHEILGRQDASTMIEAEHKNLAAQIAHKVQSVLVNYRAGVKVVAVDLPDIEPPEQAKAAFEEAAKAQAERQRLVNEAKAQAAALLPQVQAEVARQLADAQAYRQEKVAQAQGEVNRFVGLLKQYQQAPKVTRQRLYLETMEDILAENPKIILRSNANNVIQIPWQQFMDHPENKQDNKTSIHEPSLAETEKRAATEQQAQEKR